MQNWALDFFRQTTRIARSNHLCSTDQRLRTIDLTAFSLHSFPYPSIPFRFRLMCRHSEWLERVDERARHRKKINR